MPSLHDLALIIDSPPGAYTGVGSRETPSDVCELMQDIAGWLAARDWTLRSGSADGADLAFELGCWRAEGKAEICLPKPDIRQIQDRSGRREILNTAWPKTLPEAFDIASRFHPNWRNLPEYARKLHARNVHQVLGRYLNSPSTFLLCWTPDGATTTTSSETGGTGQAIRIANDYNVPVWNLQREDHRKVWSDLIDCSECHGERVIHTSHLSSGLPYMSCPRCTQRSRTSSQ